MLLPVILFYMITSHAYMLDLLVHRSYILIILHCVLCMFLGPT